MSAPHVLISGANRGLGLEFARQYAAEGWRVYATVRDLGQGAALAELGPNVSIHLLEVTEKSSLDRLSAELKSVPIDLLIANSGVTGPRGMTPELVDRESWIEVFEVNVIGALALAGAFKPNLLKGKMRRAVALSSSLSSMALNQTGGLYAYRASKAGLNAVWRSLAIDWKDAGIACGLLVPGWVKTDMGGPQAELEPAESIEGMRRVIDTLSIANTGLMWSHKGELIPW